MTDELREAAQFVLDDDLLAGQAQQLIGALMSRGFLPNTLSSAEHTTLWGVVKRQLRRVNKDGARAALARQDAQAVPQGWKLLPVEPTPEMCNPSGDVGIVAEMAARYRREIWESMLNAAPTPPAQEKQS